MGKEYNHLDSEDRDSIAVLRAQGKTIGEIARILGRNKSTISRELRRNSSPAYTLYRSHRAQKRADTRRKAASRRVRLKNEQTVNYVVSKLRDGLSPELIAGRIGIDHPGLSISAEAIYQYVYHPGTPNRLELIGFLVRAHRKRKQKGIGRKQHKTKIPDRVSIEERPVEVESRKEFGHWEGDSIVSGKKSKVAVNSLVERSTRLTKLTKIPRKTASDTADAVKKRLGPLPKEARLTLTMDNGTENAGHQGITKALGIKCYFAHPYSSWERGTNEHMNGLVRRYLPKGTDFGKISDERIAQIESIINNRPMKCLGFKSPLEAASAFVALQP